ncbi:MAG TPA: hypothetical protein VMT32_05060 [Bryobacteraceae bacterium]|nr:hypothetical protein [Bryobacteraceae bacterium]
MNLKRYLAASFAVFVVSMALGYLIHGVILKPVYDSLQSIWRPGMESKMWIEWVNAFLLSFLFTYIFIKGYEGKGIAEGARFGLLMGLFLSIPVAYGTYMIIPIPYTLALQWFLYGVAQSIVFGVVAAAIYKPAAT